MYILLRKSEKASRATLREAVWVVVRLVLAHNSPVHSLGAGYCLQDLLLALLGFGLAL